MYDKKHKCFEIFKQKMNIEINLVIKTYVIEPLRNCGNVKI